MSIKHIAMSFAASALVLACTCTAQETDADKIKRLESELRATKAELGGARERIHNLETTVERLQTEGAVDNRPLLRAGDSVWQGPMHILFPSAVTIPKGQVYGRVVHVSKDTFDSKVNGSGTKSEPFHNLLGLDSGVQISSMFGYGITDNWEVSLQRSNGRTILVRDLATARTYDSWDIMSKYQLLHADDDGLNLALLGGVTWMLEDNENGIVSLNLGVSMDKTVADDRLLLGTGVLFASQSDYLGTISPLSNTAATKRHPKEPDSSVLPGLADGPDHTLAVPVTVRLALADHWHLFSDAIFPVDGFDTGKGPTLAIGARHVKKVRGRYVVEYSAFVTNSSNTAFNSVLTGAYRRGRLDLFGFNISVHY